MSAGALLGPRGRLDAAALDQAASAFAATLRAQGVRVLATLLDNDPAWRVADRGALQAGVPHVPLPGFFSPAQIRHALQASGADALLAAPDAAARLGLPAQPLAVADAPLALVRLPAQPVALPPDTAKITFTSGTTGAPKGVCLTAAGLAAVQDSLRAALGPLGIARHLCALPLAVLLEDVAGAGAAQAHGAEVVALPLASLGLHGSSSFDPAAFDAAVRQWQPGSLILLPQMLAAWAAWLGARGERAPAGLRFVAAGGAAVGAPLLAAARALGIPAHEGYGLSEGGSVQTLNLPGADRAGSVGRPLPHARVRLAADGEIEVAGTLFAGYLGQPPRDPQAWWPTGDLGRIDADGYVHVDGRKRNVLVTAYGRKVSPEWVEGALQAAGGIAQAVVLGEGQSSLSAVLWAWPGADDARLQAAVDAANAGLPDYARIARWIRAAGPFTAEAGYATANGRPRRDAVLQAHAASLGLPSGSPASIPSHVPKEHA